MQYLDLKVYVPRGTLATYQAADTWKEFWDIQEFDATDIEDVNDDALAFECTSGGILFTNATGNSIAIYTASGSLVVNITNYDGAEIALDKGLYIIVVNGKSVKAILK